MNRGDLFSITVSALLLYWVRLETGQGAIEIIYDALPSLL